MRYDLTAPLRERKDTVAKSLLATIFAFSSVFCSLSTARADAPHQSEIESVVLLRSPTAQSCATGFLLGQGMVVTNHHVTTLACDDGVCRGLTLAHANRIDGAADYPVKFLSATVLHDLPALDLTVLKLAGSPEADRPLRLPIPAEMGAGVQVLGFPDCNKLTLSSGYVDSRTTLAFTTSARGRFGSSGSAVFDSSLNLVGIAHRSSSLAAATLASIVPVTFPLEAVRAELLTRFLEGDPQNRCGQQAALVLEQYRAHVRNLHGLTRLAAGANFISDVDTLLPCIGEPLAGTALDLLFAVRGEYTPSALALFNQGPGDKRTASFENLILAYNFELKGPFRKLLRQLEPQSVIDRIRALGREAEQTKSMEEIASFAMQQRFYGLEVTGLVWGTTILVVTLLLTIVWGWTGALVFTNCSGGFFRRVLVTGATLLILWPISVPVVLWVGRQRARKAALKKLI